MAQVKDPPQQACRAGAPAPCLQLAGTPVCPGSGFRAVTALGCTLLSGHQLWAGQGVTGLLSREELVLSGPLVGRAGIKEARDVPNVTTRVVVTRRSPWKLLLPRPHQASGKGPARAHGLSPACVRACTAPHARPRTRVQTQWLKGQGAGQPTLYC